MLAVDAEHFDARINLANLLAEFGRVDDACAEYDMAVSSAPDAAGRARAYVYRGNALRRAGRDEDAIAAYDSALTLQPHDGLAIKRALTVPIVPRSRAQIGDVRARVEREIDVLMARDLLVDDPGLETSTTNFYLAYHALDDRALQQKTAALHLKACPGLSWTAPHCRARKRRAGGPIRLGIASAYLRRHSVGRLNVGMIAGLDPERFELFVFSTASSEDPLAREIAARAAAVTAIPQDIELARRTIAEAELDILYYPEIGMDVLAYFCAFARLAPVQCVGWGHPDTTGIPNVDYFVSSALLEPETADAAYSEKLYRLATLPTCYRRPEIPDTLKTRAELGLPSGRRLYLCPQSAFKLHPDVDALFGGILSGDPEGEVIVIEGAVAAWTGQFLERLARSVPGARDRVRVIPRQSPEDFLSLLAAADVILDTPHFSGGNTSFEAFALAKPIVTHDGEFMRGRVTAALYRKMDIRGCIAASLEDYVEIALRLGLDLDYRAEIAAQIDAFSDILFDDQESVREWERFFSTAVHAS